ncbi:MAG TPA: GNAT family N-acetyltransferase [Pyrinomonadaceae bacterium]|nr:GNAT family N-acetyltransferase [Pyrinomonadaceae bacterium]
MSTKVNHSALRIRKATEQDVPEILNFIRELAAYEKELSRVSASEAIIHEALFGPKPHAKAVLVDLEGEPAAFAIYFFSFSSFSGLPNLYLEDIFVKPAYRGRGIGKALMAFLAEIANENSCGRMEWSVLNWNERSIQFYRQLGAEPVEDWTVFHLGKDVLTKLTN